jgi:hypothetical protein
MAQVSNWRPKEMLSLKQFCMNVDERKPNFVADLQQDGKIRAELTTEK